MPDKPFSGLANLENFSYNGWDQVNTPTSSPESGTSQVTNFDSELDNLPATIDGQELPYDSLNTYSNFIDDSPMGNFITNQQSLIQNTSNPLVSGHWDNVGSLKLPNASNNVSQEVDFIGGQNSYFPPIDPFVSGFLQYPVLKQTLLAGGLNPISSNLDDLLGYRQFPFAIGNNKAYELRTFDPRSPGRSNVPSHSFPGIENVNTYRGSTLDKITGFSTDDLENYEETNFRNLGIDTTDDVIGDPISPLSTTSVTGFENLEFGQTSIPYYNEANTLTGSSLDDIYPFQFTPVSIGNDRYRQYLSGTLDAPNIFIPDLITNGFTEAENATFDEAIQGKTYDDYTYDPRSGRITTFPFGQNTIEITNKNINEDGPYLGTKFDDLVTFEGTDFHVDYTPYTQDTFAGYATDTFTSPLLKNAKQFSTLYNLDQSAKTDVLGLSLHFNRDKISNNPGGFKLFDQAGWRGNEPYVVHNIPEGPEYTVAGPEAEDNFGDMVKSLITLDLPGNVLNFGNRMFPLMRSLTDIKRQGKFWLSGAGLWWTAKQVALQFLNPRNARAYNPGHLISGIPLGGAINWRVSRHFDVGFLKDDRYESTVWELNMGLLKGGAPPSDIDDILGKIGNLSAGKYPWSNTFNGGNAFQVIGGNLDQKNLWTNSITNVAPPPMHPLYPSKLIPGGVGLDRLRWQANFSNQGQVRSLNVSNWFTNPGTSPRVSGDPIKIFEGSNQLKLKTQAAGSSKGYSYDTLKDRVPGTGAFAFAFGGTTLPYGLYQEEFSSTTESPVSPNTLHSLFNEGSLTVNNTSDRIRLDVLGQHDNHIKNQIDLYSEKSVNSTSAGKQKQYGVQEQYNILNGTFSVNSSLRAVNEIRLSQGLSSKTKENTPAYRNVDTMRELFAQSGQEHTLKPNTPITLGGVKFLNFNRYPTVLYKTPEFKSLQRQFIDGFSKRSRGDTRAIKNYKIDFWTGGEVLKLASPSLIASENIIEFNFEDTNLIPTYEGVIKQLINNDLEQLPSGDVHLSKSGLNAVLPAHHQASFQPGGDGSIGGTQESGWRLGLLGQHKFHRKSMFDILNKSIPDLKFKITAENSVPTDGSLLEIANNSFQGKDKFPKVIYPTQLLSISQFIEINSKYESYTDRLMIFDNRDGTEVLGNSLKSYVNEDSFLTHLNEKLNAHLERLDYTFLTNIDDDKRLLVKYFNKNRVIGDSFMLNPMDNVNQDTGIIASNWDGVYEDEAGIGIVQENLRKIVLTTPYNKSTVKRDSVRLQNLKIWGATDLTFSLTNEYSSNLIGLKGFSRHTGIPIKLRVSDDDTPHLPLNWPDTEDASKVTSYETYVADAEKLSYEEAGKSKGFFTSKKLYSGDIFKSYMDRIWQQSLNKTDHRTGKTLLDQLKQPNIDADGVALTEEARIKQNIEQSLSDDTGERYQYLPFKKYSELDESKYGMSGAKGRTTFSKHAPFGKRWKDSEEKLLQNNFYPGKMDVKTGAGAFFEKPESGPQGKETPFGDLMTMTQIRSGPTLDDGIAYGTDMANAIESDTNGYPFYFKDLRDDSYIILRGYIDSIAENIIPKWSEQVYLGRSEPVYGYESATRDINITFKLAPQTKRELKMIYKKLNKLTSMCYPEYKNDTGNFPSKLRAKPPLVKFRLGELYGKMDNELSGIIKSLSYKFLSNAVWETEKDFRVPKFVDANMSFRVIHDSTPDYNTSFYGIQNQLKEWNTPVALPKYEDF